MAEDIFQFKNIISKQVQHLQLLWVTYIQLRKGLLHVCMQIIIANSWMFPRELELSTTGFTFLWTTLKKIGLEPLIYEVGLFMVPKFCSCT